MKILAIVSAIDLKHKLGCTPSWWQLLKALREIGNEVVVIPYLGRAVESLWWRTRDNPCCSESLLYNRYLEMKQKMGISPCKKGVIEPVSSRLISSYIRPKWEKYLKRVLQEEKGIDFILFLNVPLNHLGDIPLKIKKEFNVPVAYYDGDMPTILPKYSVDRGFKFDYYEGADLSYYDAFFTNSKGVIQDLAAMGAKNVRPLYYAADPEIFQPVEVRQDNDVFFYGHGNELREEWMTKMIAIPSIRMRSSKFLLAGKGFTIDMGNARVIQDVPMSDLATYVCRSKVSLNITRWSHAVIYGSSTARPFELASYGACIISQPYNGMEEWFKVGKELLVVNSEDEAVETYGWLLSNDEERARIGERARQRLLREHTYKHRARAIVESI